MSLFFNEAQIGASGAGTTGYTVDRSLRFDSSSDNHLEVTDTRTVSTGAYTFSLWFKRTKAGESQGLYIQNGSNTQMIHIAIYSDQIKWYNHSGSDADAAVSDGLIIDSNAWYHLVCKKPSGSAGTMYINGVAQTSTSFATDIDAFSMERHIGNRDSGSGDRHFNGYIAEFHAIDGTAVAHTEFGETSDDTGQWIPKKYTGSYGTKGFYLNFSDNSGTTATTLGKDSSGNGNNWTPTNFSVSSGSGNDSLLDSPTNNYCTVNYNAEVGTLTNGALDVVTGASSYRRCVGTFGVSSGKWYWETKIINLSGGLFTGIGDRTDYSTGNTFVANQTGTYGWYNFSTTTNKYVNGSSSTYGNVCAANDVIGLALDLDGGTLVMYKNGTSQGTVATGLSGTFVPVWGDGSASSTTTFETNFGQRDFVISSVPAGHKALCTSNLTDPTIVKAKDHFNTVLYTGNATGRNLVSDFSTNLVWIKKRSGAESHVLANSVIGADNFLSTDSTAAQNTASQCVTAFISTGVTIGTQGIVNDNTETFASWHWKESASAGFDIVSYSGSGAAQNIAHSLGVAPEVGIFKKRNDTYNWFLYTELFDGSLDYMHLNTATAKANSTWSTLLDSASNIQMEGDSAALNASGDTYIAYLFASVEGFSKLGTYTGNGSSSAGPFVFTGFAPAWLMIKRGSGGSGSWTIWDRQRNPSNVSKSVLWSNSNSGEDTNTDYSIDLLANGFKIKTTYADQNTSGDPYLYIAFAENSLKSANAR